MGFSRLCVYVCFTFSLQHHNAWSRPATLVPHQLPHLTRLFNWSHSVIDRAAWRELLLHSGSIHAVFLVQEPIKKKNTLMNARRNPCHRWKLYIKPKSCKVHMPCSLMRAGVSLVVVNTMNMDLSLQTRGAKQFNQHFRKQLISASHSTDYYHNLPFYLLSSNQIKNHQSYTMQCFVLLDKTELTDEGRSHLL